jgi:hypothetical protein
VIYLLDTDHISILLQQLGLEFATLLVRKKARACHRPSIGSTGSPQGNLPVERPLS